ncbi:MAG: alpha/beta hydrolase [Myxococcota bacterium]
MAALVEPTASYPISSTVETPRGSRRPPRLLERNLQVYQFGEIDPEKETFIIVMGRGQSAAAYTDAWVQENQHRYNIFAYDQPSQGLSDPQREGDAPRYGDIESFAHYPQHLNNVVEHVTGVMREHGIDESQRPHVFGHSLGGWTVKRYNQMEQYRDRVETVHTSAHMARIEVRADVAKRYLGEDGQLWNGVAIAANLVNGIRNGMDAPASDPARGFSLRSQSPWSQTGAAEQTARAYDIERADPRLQTDRPTVRWANQGMLAALALHLPGRTTYAPEFHVIPTHDVVSDPAYMELSARRAVHGAYVAMEGMLHDGLRWSPEDIRRYSELQEAFVNDPDSMRGDQTHGIQNDPNDRAAWYEFPRMLLSRRGPMNRQRHAEARALQAASRERFETLNGE